LFAFGDAELDSDRRELRLGGKSVPIEPQVFDLLAYLLRHRDRVVSKEELLNAVWGGRIVSDGALSTRLNAVRRALGDNGRGQRLVRTYPRKGIRFIGEVQEKAAPAPSRMPSPQLDPMPSPQLKMTALPHGASTAAAAAVEVTLLAGEPANGRANSEPPAELCETLERRQLTVMVCLLVAAGLDPEQVHAVWRAYCVVVREEAGRFGGYVAESLGCGLLVCFGYPEAHEDDAERAVRAGLALLDHVGRLGGVAELLTIHIGIATGLVVVGDLIGADGAAAHGVLGEAPDLAARLQATAEPGAILIDEQTRRLVGGLFEYSEVRPQDVRQLGGPISVWQVLRPNQTESRFEALHGSPTTPLVGREEEIELLLRRWARAEAGDGRAVLVSGEPGIGKSRLAASLLQRIGSGPHACIRYSCSPHHQHSMFYPVVAQLERAARFESNDNPETRLDKLESLLAANSPPRDDIALIAELLSVPGDDRYPRRDLTPQRKREQLFTALLRHLDGASRRQPVLMIFEDLHWIDPTSREFIDRLVEWSGRHPLLLILTFRPEFDAPWIGQPGVTALALNRLGLADSTALVQSLTSGKRALPSQITAKIVQHADGVPLFVEEMTKAVLESGYDPVANASTATPSPGIPATLHASLLARIDRLGLAAKQVAQIAAAIGREFSYELLFASGGALGERTLNEGLQRLVEAGLLFQQGMPPAAKYLFKHALIQDTAYSTLVRPMHQDIHRRIGEALEAQFSSLIEAQPEIAARHFGEALQTEKAIAYWHRAGEASVAKSAVREAELQLRRGLSLLRSLPESGERKRRELDFHITLISALMGARGYADPEMAVLLERSQQLLSETGSVGSPLNFSVLYGIWVVAYVGGNAKSLLDLASEFQSLSESQPNSGLRLIGHRILGSSLMVVGNYRDALPHLALAASLYSSDEHRELAFLFGQDLGATALCYLAWAQWHNGYLDQAALTTDRAIRHAREFEHAHTLVYTLWHAATVALLAQDAARVATLASEVVAISAEHGFAMWLAYGDIFAGWAAARQGEVTGGVARIRSGIVAAAATGAELFEPLFLGLLAEGLTLDGSAAEALARLDEASVTATRTGNVAAVADLWRSRGMVLQSLGAANNDRAESAFGQAIAEARRQGSRFYELRAATSLARLWRGQGLGAEARELLAPIYSWFTEGFDTRDLKGARAMLDEL
jgi:DNA-binding winged helix-turn-helix (wHTH) protein/class 3 adenylate cyclase/predicted ATPase